MLIALSLTLQVRAAWKNWHQRRMLAFPCLWPPHPPPQKTKGCYKVATIALNVLVSILLLTFRAFFIPSRKYPKRQLSVATFVDVNIRLHAKRQWQQFQVKQHKKAVWENTFVFYSIHRWYAPPRTQARKKGTENISKITDARVWHAQCEVCWSLGRSRMQWFP